jgi:predicted class III extradiol MEMO1 family dioxygenase
MSEDRMTVFELKEKAKWSSDPEEKKAAIKELSTRGENAISELQEIMSITAYGDIRNACAEAIKSMRQARSKVEINETSSSSSTTTSYSSSNSAANVVVTKDQKKEKFEKKEEEAKSA